MLEWSELWWASITGPCSFSVSVAQALREGNQVYLFVPDDLPWREMMRICIDHELHRSPEMESFLVEFIDVEDECPETADVGRYLLDRFVSPEIAAGYRGREKIQKYIIDNNVIENKVLWVKGMTQEQEKIWLQFCREYAPARARNGRFVLELPK